MTSSVAAIAASLGLASLFVGSLYMAPRDVRNRNYYDPVQIRWRMKASIIATGIAPIITSFFVDSPTWNVLPSIGIQLENLTKGSIIPIAGVIMLYTGPLLNNILTWWSHPNRDLEALFPNCPTSSLMLCRNLIVAPITEEIVFRGCIGCILKSASFRPSTIIWTGPLYFGIAHLHHAYGDIRGGTPISTALVRAFVQLSYTTLFGALEMYYFLQTGVITGVIMVHSWCNLLGLPSFEYLQPQHENYSFRHWISIGYLFGILGFSYSTFKSFL